MSLVSEDVGVSVERADAAAQRLQRRFRFRRGVLSAEPAPVDGGGFGVVIVVSRPVEGLPRMWRGVPVWVQPTRAPRAL